MLLTFFGLRARTLAPSALGVRAGAAGTRLPSACGCGKRNAAGTVVALRYWRRRWSAHVLGGTFMARAICLHSLLSCTFSNPPRFSTSTLSCSMSNPFAASNFAPVSLLVLTASFSSTDSVDVLSCDCRISERVGSVHGQSYVVAVWHVQRKWPFCAQLQRRQPSVDGGGGTRYLARGESSESDTETPSRTRRFLDPVFLVFLIGNTSLRLENLHMSSRSFPISTEISSLLCNPGTALFAAFISRTLVR
mmetsp:Transcript_63554/g.102759  ORF Transcript_63554/g.102759 Transcript_63554/m.102759 type:complete len:249 (+) Transcript_63554:921-1667(+)